MHRFIGEKLRFSDLNSNELNEIKLFDRFSIPTLKECMEAFPNTKFNIDLKTNEVMKPAMKYLHSINAHSRVCIASFSDQRLDFVRAYFDKNDKNKIIPFSKQDSSMINLFSKCDCLILRKPFEKKALKNTKVNFIKFPDLI